MHLLTLELRLAWMECLGGIHADKVFLMQLELNLGLRKNW